VLGQAGDLLAVEPDAPELGAVSPEIRRKNVVLPAPLGPMIERSSPRLTLTSTPGHRDQAAYARVSPRCAAGRRRTWRESALAVSGVSRHSHGIRTACGIVRRTLSGGGMARHVVPTRWKSGMIEIGPKIFAYVQSSGVDPLRTGIANSGLIVGSEGAVAVDALMVRR